MGTGVRRGMSAIGIESHSGWAALVVLAGPVGAPAVVLRRRVELADPTDQAAKQPFHAAEDLPWPEAKAFIAAAVSDARRRAREELDAVLHALASEQFSPRRCGIVTASGRALPDLRSILASHALIHAAEGEHFRKALAEAAESRGVAPVRISRKELPERAAAAIGISAKEAVRRVSSFGAALGPPWASDQKLAAMAAWIALR